MSVSDEEYARRLQLQLEDEEFAKSLQQQLNLERGSAVTGNESRRNDYESFDAVLNNVTQMAQNLQAQSLADKYGLNIVNVTWEDNVRYKNSSWGPCISDMTLKVQGHNLPIIRSPNYEDLTWDVPIEKVPLVVGNEHGEPLRPTNLKEYLQNFRWNLHNPHSWGGNETSLYAPNRDSHVIFSAQSCFLPIPKLGGEVEFNVSIFNYMSHSRSPAVLAIVANSCGTSAHIVEGGHGGQKLYFNKNGQKCPFVGTRLAQHRIEKGEEYNLKQPMSEKEKEQNMLLIIQVPLKRIEQSHLTPYPLPTPCVLSDCDLESISYPSPAHVYTSSVSPGSFSARHYKMRNATPEKANTEDAIIKVGDEVGEFREIDNLRIERDPLYPIRVTLQHYKATSNTTVEESQIQAIFEQIKSSRKFGTSIGSLVVSPHSGRPTDVVSKDKDLKIPIWWSEFWLTYGAVFPQFKSEGEAAQYVFKNGRFRDRTMGEVTPLVLDLLGNVSDGREVKNDVSWKVY